MLGYPYQRRIGSNQKLAKYAIGSGREEVTELWLWRIGYSMDSLCEMMD